MISLAGLNRADVLAALYNAARPQGMGFLQYDPTPMTREQAEAILNNGHTYFDYLKGRVMKISLAADELEEQLYDRDNGQGAAEQVIAALRTNSADVIAAGLHEKGILLAAADVKTRLTEPTRLTVETGIHTVTIGLSDVADVLGPAVDRALEKR